MARTVFIHRVLPYVWSFSCRKYRICTVYVWFWLTLVINGSCHGIGQLLTLKLLCLLSCESFVIQQSDVMAVHSGYRLQISHQSKSVTLGCCINRCKNVRSVCCSTTAPQTIAVYFPCRLLCDRKCAVCILVQALCGVTCAENCAECVLITFAFVHSWNV